MEDTSPWADLLWVVGGITSVLVLLETIRRTIVRPVVHALRVATDFASDWNGVPERDGQPARPGVMATLALISARLERVEYHTGNGQEPALRAIVEQHSLDLAKLKRSQGIEEGETS